MSASLYKFSQETKEALRKFRLSTSRAKDAQARIYNIDPKTQEIKCDDETTYTDLQELKDELPTGQPRFILLSYPYSKSDGRFSVPYVLLYYMPDNCNPSLRMSYAGAKELMRSTAEAQRVIDIDDDDEVDEIEKKVKGEEE